MLRQFPEWVEEAQRVTEVFADVGGKHRPHAEFSRSEITSKTADIECRNRGGDWISAIFESRVGLREKAGDETRQRVACAGSAESSVAGRVDKNATVRRRDK